MNNIVSTIGKGFLLLLLVSCVNTSYSRLDEVAINDELVDIILGQFPHHGKAFYENEIKIKEPLLIESPDNFELRNDVAVAYLKIVAWDKAQAHFDENEKRHPNQYKTHANLGVMYKKMGEYEKAAFHVKKSLEIKPEGHMGLGDYYLKMIQWKLNYNKDQKTNFLGVPYSNSAQTAKVANKEYVITLIKNDYQFIDAYLVLGDILFEEKNYQLAMRSYQRAYHLIKSDKFSTQKSIAQVKFIKIKAKLKRDSFFSVIDWRGAKRQISKEIVDAESWLKSFQKTEALLISRSSSISFQKIRNEMELNEVNKPLVLEAMLYKAIPLNGVFLYGFLIILPFAILYIFSKRKQNRLRQERSFL